MAGGYAWVTVALLAGLLVTGAVWDCRTQRVPNWLTLPAVPVGIIWNVLAAWLQSRGAFSGFQDAMVGLGVGLIPFMAVYAMGGLGGGDVKIMAAIGAVSGSWEFVLATSFYGLFFGLVMAVWMMVRHGLVRRTFSRIFGAALTVYAKVKPGFPEDSPRIPFALAVCLGGLLAGAEIFLGLQTPWAEFVVSHP